MEQHPIPRNITGFQFKLIGDMTLRQFGYLAGGAVIGYALFKLLPLPGIFNIAIGGLIAFIGFAFAFLPFQDRPIDQWLLAFIKSVFSPTQYIYYKDNPPPEVLNQAPTVVKISGYHEQQYRDSKKLLDNYLARLPVKTIDSLDQNEQVALSQTLSLFAATPQPNIMIKRVYSPPVPTKPRPVPPAVIEANKSRSMPPPVHPVKKEPEKERGAIYVNDGQVKQLTEELNKLRQQIKTGFQTKSNDPQLEKRFLELEQKLTTLLTEREKLTAELIKLRQGDSFTGKMVRPQVAKEEPSISNVKIISQQQATKVGILNPPTTPNLVIGVIKDPNGMTISNILITVKDMRANPLRALKTNNLGQFFASTPLSNGTYVLEVEDPQKEYAFDLIELKLTGTTIQPLEITAKRQVDPVRDRLSKELFQKSFN